MSVPRAPLLEVVDVSKVFGNVVALERVSMSVHAGRVTCLLGDNGAGKSTLVRILAGVHRPSTGRYEVEGATADFGSPIEARERGIATVYQDLAMIPLMSIWRNFFLGSEPTSGWGPLKRVDVKRCERIAREELAKMGIEVRDASQAVGTLSGGERQSVAVARAVYFGARVLILDEPTAALGVRQAGIALGYVERAREAGIGIVLVTHNPHQAYPIGDHFVVLRRGRVVTDCLKSELSLEQLTELMAGGEPPGGG
ncbi:MAG TPA: ATP-binding cassette domain-containing protein [Longimicrobiales bacterium]|nr:ATP-binding cassette domain-containing protein [Longimicrobiales bacterium]